MTSTPFLRKNGAVLGSHGFRTGRPNNTALRQSGFHIHIILLDPIWPDEWLALSLRARSVRTLARMTLVAVGRSGQSYEDGMSKY